eukprot:6457021-Amphidinium_carterae.1
MHIESGAVWTDELTLALRRATRAAERGLGPPRQSAPLPLERVASITSDANALVDGAPVGGIAFILAGALFLHREIEVATARASHVSFSEDARAVH